VIRVTVPEALAPTHPVTLFVAITLYTPATVVVKLATFPGFGTEFGTVQTYE
jgi:hypothetical protein